MSIHFDKHFDISYAIRRFNENPNLLLEDIANEFGMTRKEMVQRMKEKAGEDERNRVRQALRQDKRRKRQFRNKAARETTSQVAEIQTGDDHDEAESVHEMNVISSSICEQRKYLETELEDAKQHFASVLNMEEVYEGAAELFDEIITRLKREIALQEHVVEELESNLANAKLKLANLRTQLSQEQTKNDDNSEKLRGIKVKVRENQEYIDMLCAELEKLNSNVLYLIDPMYDLTHGIPSVGRFISTIKMDGVEAELIDSDRNQLSFSQIVTISHETGYSDILELRKAYDFAWLAIHYMLEPDCEVHVVTDDDRLIKLINYLIS